MKQPDTTHVIYNWMCKRSVSFIINIHLIATKQSKDMLNKLAILCTHMYYML